MSNKTLSIVIPTIGRNVLDRTIESVFAQTVPPFELIVWDNSGKGSANRESAYSNHPDVKWRIAGQQVPVIDSWNTAVSFAEGSHVYILGDDDLLEPDFCEKVTASLESGFDLIHVTERFMDMDGNLRPFYGKTKDDHTLSSESFIREYATGGKYNIFLGSLVFPRNAFDEIGKFKNIIPNGVAMDVLFHLELLNVIGEIRILGKPLWRYRTQVSDWCGRLKRKEDIPQFYEQYMSYREYIKPFFSDSRTRLKFYRRWIISPMVGICYSCCPSAAVRFLLNPEFSFPERLSILRDLFYCLRHL